MLFLKRETVACHGKHISNERHVLLNSLIYCKRSCNVLNYCSHVDRKSH